MPGRRVVPSGTAISDDATFRRERQEFISRSLENAIYQLNHPYCLTKNDRLRRTISKGISFPKNNNKCGNGNNGKPHDVETRIALTLYHQWKRDAIADRNEKENRYKKKESTDSIKTINTATDTDRASSPQTQSSVVTITSDLGLSREVSSPRQLADLIVPFLEEDFRSNPKWNMSPDVRSQASGIVSMISVERTQMLRLAGRLPCPHCIQWCKGEKGLWWHQQQYHAVEHSNATAVAQATTINGGAMVIYKEPDNCLTTRTSINGYIDGNNDTPRWRHHSDDPMELIRKGNLDGLKSAVRNHGYCPSTTFDTRGATPLMWAAGGGHLDIARYLIEDCNCDPCQSQRGKRSFAGRTALHWAARNGHVNVVRYLLSLAGADLCCSNGDRTNDFGTTLSPMPTYKLLEAKTQDGTTAFGWACWQRHLEVMECLHRRGCDIHVLNGYGCSPVLWCSQGTNGNGLQALKWLRDRGCNMKLVNHNGHGVLHKAAQRGQRDVAEWLIREECDSLITTTTTTSSTDSKTGATERNTLLALVGPDIEGYCPSDLAGMEGHDDFANWLVTIEIQVCQSLDCTPSYEIPAGFSSDGVPFDKTASSVHIWEQYGGLRRMKSAVMGSDM